MLHWNSLLTRMILGVLGIVAVMSALLFLGIDYLVSTQFQRLHQERVEQYAAEVRRVLDRELKTLSTMAAFTAQDSGLNHATQYHLYFGGERRSVTADVDRVASNFQLESVTLWDAAGSLVVHSGIALPASPRWAEEAFVEAAGVSTARAEMVGDKLWLVAMATLRHRDTVLARIQIGRPIDYVLRSLALSGGRVGLVMQATEPAPGTFRIPVTSAGRDDVLLEISVTGLVESALTQTKRLLVAGLLMTSALLVALIGVYLRRQLRPIKALTRVAHSAAAAIRSGDVRQVRAAGTGEIARLTAAFNEMMRDLAKYARIERELRHKEQLTAIGRVATRVAHDINNPLTVIKNTAILALRDPATPEDLRPELELVIHHCERCHRTVENLLRFGRPLRLKLAELDVGDFLAGYLARRRHDALAAPCRLIGPPMAVRAEADAVQLEQLLDNLLDNAQEASGGREITVEYGVEQEDTVFVRVVDGGPGFASDAIERAFELYYTTKTNGTGLGLPNALAIARAHGGDIRITGPERGEVTVNLRMVPRATEPAQA
ncbi:MAG TPA: HAMP domain-containing sensor histidine kinase [Azospirillum sp.]